MNCPQCGKNVPDNARFCNFCGGSLDQEDAAAKEVTQSHNTSNGSSSYDYQQNIPVQPTVNNKQVDEVLSIGQYVLMIILTAIPIVGFIMLLVWTFGSDVNRNKKNYAIAALIMMAVGVVISIIFGAAIIAIIAALFSDGYYYYY